MVAWLMSVRVCDLFAVFLPLSGVYACMFLLSMCMVVRTYACVYLCMFECES